MGTPSIRKGPGRAHSARPEGDPPKARPARHAGRLRPAALLAAHAAGFAAAYLLAFAIRFDGAVPRAAWAAAVASLPLVLAIQLAAVLAAAGHRGWWRQASVADIGRMGWIGTLALAGPALASLGHWGGSPIPRSVIPIDGALAILMLAGARVATGWATDGLLPWAAAPRVLVVGTGGAGEALAVLVPRLGMRVVGFLDPDPATHGRTLAGVRVLGSPGEVRRIATARRAGTVYVPIPAVPAPAIRGLVAACAGTGIRVQVVPGIEALLAGDVTVQPRDVDIRDLLCREPVQIEAGSLGAFLTGRSVLVSGAAGSIGREICRQVLPFGPARLVLLDHAENGLFYFERELVDRAAEVGCELVPFMASITDAPRLRAAFAEHRPAVVFHAAAHKHVPMMEANPGEAVKNNVLGTRTLAEAAIAAGAAAFVMISTDKAVNPTSVMGATKRLAEMVVQSLAGGSGTRLVTVRFGNVLGSTGSVVPIFREQIRDGGPVTVTHPDMTRYFMTIPEAAQLVLQAGALGGAGDIFVLDMGEPVKVLDLARDLIRLSGRREGRDIEIVFTGLRPGEKLYEELYDEAESRLPTPHPKIFRARHRPCDPRRFRADLDALARLADRPAAEVIAALGRLLPEYRPSRPGAGAPAPRPALAGPVPSAPKFPVPAGAGLPALAGP